ncbi:asparagine synthase C-terminal domain-containing protein [Sphingobium estronivorans]|uniref:asparagine synthase-related protein n=1 Tax=Sphingobium estronivorans TaxID=1577690 RepID=UPI00123C3C4A|nr:asparagine synthase C-terminal domain-containing protein [Sphingobium estronivorans]
MSAGTIPLHASDPLRFCALLAPSGSSTAQRARTIAGALRSRLPDLMVLADDPGFLLLVRPPHPGWALHAAREGRTQVLGSLLPGTLPKDSLPAALEASTDPIEAMSVLTRLCWGRYVAFIHDPERQQTSFMRDPSGALRAYIWKVDGLTLITGGLPDALLDSVGVPPAIDWSALATLTALPERVGSLSALTDVTIPLPGTIYHIGKDAIITQGIWSPAAVARQDAAPLADLPRVLANCIAGWANGSSPVSIELSGGLDSSLILGGLARRKDRPEIHALNLVPGATGGGESRFANAVAGHWDVPLVEVGIHPGEIDYLAHLERSRPEQPLVYGLDLVADQTSVRTADHVGATTILSGQGGDAVLFQPRGPHIAADRLRAKGPGPTYWRLLAASAASTDRSIWSSLWRSLRPLPMRAAANFQPALAGPQLRAQLDAGLPSHPWMVEAERLPPGRRLQIAMLSNCQIFHAPTLTSAGLRLAHPMLSQPVIEHCLRVPTWELVPDERDRGGARDVLADWLPQAVRERRTKGEATGFYSRAIALQFDRLGPMLREGHLVRQNIIDRAALESMLDPEALLWRGDHSLIATLVAMELWAQRWA